MSLLSQEYSLFVYLSSKLYNLSNWITSLNNTFKKLRDNPMTMGGVVEVKYHSVLASDNTPCPKEIVPFFYFFF